MVDNNPKTDPSNEGQLDNKAVKVDRNEPISLKEAEAVVDAEEGQIEEAIEKQRLEKDTEIAPDLVELKKEQTEKKKEVKQKKKEVKKAVKVEKETVTPSKFEGKTDEERLIIYQEMESSFTKKSQKIAELEAKVADLDTVNKKIEEYEKTSVINQQKATKVKLPEKPKMSLFYEDPEKYFAERDKYQDAKNNATIAPLYGQNWNTQKQNVINDLKKATEKDIVPYEKVETEVESRVRRNPVLVNQYGTKVREYFYSQIRNEQLPQKIDEIKTEAKEEAKRELAEESNENSESQIMSSDINTQSREGKAVDLEKILVDEDNPEKVINAYKHKYSKKVDF